jgi:excisionase family DNA binding protein
MPSPTFLTYAEAADRLGVTEHWLRKAVREKRVAHSRLSDRVIRFTAEDIDAIREASRVAPEAKASKSGPTPSRRRTA